jgi:DNA-binding XRE family transcriptional regulator
MEPRQCRAGRALLDLTQADLARRAGVSLSTVVALEGGQRGTHASNVARIKSALEASGVVFKNDGSLTTCDQILDAFAKIKNPSAEQTAEATTAAHRVALAGGRGPEPMNAGAAAIVAAYNKATENHE